MMNYRRHDELLMHSRFLSVESNTTKRQPIILSTFDSLIDECHICVDDNVDYDVLSRFQL
jgi:hypothetical protein